MITPFYMLKPLTAPNPFFGFLANFFRHKLIIANLFAFAIKKILSGNFRCYRYKITKPMFSFFWKNLSVPQIFPALFSVSELFAADILQIT